MTPTRPRPHRFPRPVRGGVATAGVMAMVSAVVGLTGLTWASQSATPGADAAHRTIAAVAAREQRERAAAPLPDRAARAARANRGQRSTAPEQPAPCRLSVDDGVRELNSAQVRTLTMVAAVGHQIGAPAEMTARVIDIAFTDPAELLPKVTDALDLFARADDRAPSEAGLAALRALSKPATLSCAWALPSGPEQQIGPKGLTPRAEVLRYNMLDAYGDRDLGGFAPGGISTGHSANSAHYDGRAIDVFFRPVNEANRADGWLFAQWLVARADNYGLLSVIFDDRIWTARESAQGWRPYVPPGGDPDNPILRHLDHVHVAVIDGG